MAIVNYLSVDFDVSPRIIWVDTTSSTSISVQNLIDTCMTISAQAANMDDAILLESSGKEYLVADGSVKVGLTVTLNNAKIAFKSLGGPDWILCSIEGGNVVAVEDIYTSPRVYIPVIHPTAFISVERVSSSSATLSELSAIQYASFGGGVTIDVINGIAGTAFPIGTQETPVDNLTDAVAIANTRGLDVLYINKSMTLDSGTDITGFTIIGKSLTRTDIVIDPSAICNNINIQQANVSGTLDGGTEIVHCSIGDLIYVNGHIHDSGLYGIIYLDGNKEAVINNCYTIDQDNTPIIDMGGSGQDLLLLNYSGIVAVRNLDSTSEEIGIGLDAGTVTLEDTITAGTIIVSGVGQLINNSTGSATVDSDGLISKQTISEAVYDEIGTEIQYSSFGGCVNVDVINGVSGTLYNIGTPENPVNNIPDALSIANTNGFEQICVHGDLTLGAGHNVDGFEFMGRSPSKTEITIEDAASTIDCEFKECTIGGILDGNSVLEHCKVNTLSYVNGEIRNSRLAGPITLGGGANSIFLDCGSVNPGLPPVIDMGGSGQNCIFHDYSGGLKFIDMTGDNQIRVQLDGGRVFLDPTITAGYVIVVGIGELIDNSTGTVNINTNGLMSKQTISEAVSDEIGGEIQYASFGGAVNVDVLNGVAGTSYNIGTPENPVNNVPDAVSIANTRGFKRLNIYGDINFGVGDNIDEFEVYGQQATRTSITIDSTASVVNCVFFDAAVSGTLDGNAALERCVIGDLNYIEGRIYLSTLTGTIILSGSTPTRIYDCFDGLPGNNNPVIDCGGSGRGLNLHGYSGGIDLKNKTGDDIVVLNINNGRAVLQDTVTNGEVIVRGIGSLMDSTGDQILTGTWNGATIINNTINTETIAGATWEQTQNLKYRIESLRNGHVAFGSTFYWNPATGDDANDASTYALAVKTFARAHELVTSEHGDVIIIVGGTDQIVTENIVVTKNDVHVRGQGPGTQVQVVSGTAINISGDHCSAEAIKLDGGDTGVILTGDGFSGVDLTVVNTVGNGVELTSTGSKLENVYCSGCGGNGVEVKNGSVGCRIQRCGIRSNANGININAGVIGTVLSKATDVSSNSNYGVNINPGAIGTIIYDGSIVHNNTAGDINDNGIATVIRSTDESIADEVVDKNIIKNINKNTKLIPGLM